MTSHWRRGQLRTLRRIERDLADSDPGLEALFLAFARRARGRDIPHAEKLDNGPLRMLARLWHGRTVAESAKDAVPPEPGDP